MNITVGEVVLQNKPLSNIELIHAAKQLKIPNFRGVFLRDTLPKTLKRNECGILNLDDSSGNGTHWVAWHRRAESSPTKKGTKKYYFDSFGLQPPLEMIKYLGSEILYNTEEIQPKDQVFCGHLCLYVLKEVSKGIGLQRIINDLY